jgi:uncharacterized protein (TIGR02588 family)
MNTRSRQKQGQDRSGAAETPPPLSEWIAAAIGLVLLLSSVGYLLYDAFKGEERPPSPLVRVVAVEPQAGRYLVRLRVFNESKATASALRVEGELKRGNEVVERSEMEFQHVPGRSSREGGLFFSQDPRTLQLVLSARSYQVP